MENRKREVKEQGKETRMEARRCPIHISDYATAAHRALSTLLDSHVRQKQTRRSR